jgi:hypothetical protein
MAKDGGGMRVDEQQVAAQADPKALGRALDFPDALM